MAAPNARNLEGFRLSPEAAKSLARILKAVSSRPEDVDTAMDAANAALNAHGVESIKGDFQVDSYYRNTVALYVNRGEPYKTTILYETEPERFVVISMGDWVERNARKYGIR